MLAAASAWDGLAAELESAGSTYRSMISGLIDGQWLGPSSMAMAAATTPYVEWMTTTALQAEEAAFQAKAAAAAHAAAFAMTVPPPVVAANRALLMVLVATNFFGQNTPAIAANEAEYVEMWAQDATAMYGYAGSSAAASRLTPFAPPPSPANPGGPALQSASVAQAAGTSAGTAQQTLSQMISTTLQSLASPATSTSSPAGPGLVGQLVNALDTGGPTVPTPTPTPTVTSPFGTIDAGSIVSTLFSQYAYLPGFFGIFMASQALGPLMNPAAVASLTSAGGATALPPLAALADAATAAGTSAGASAGAAMGAAAAGGVIGSGLSSSLGSLAGAGQAASVGALSVPQTWGWAAMPQVATLASASAPLALSAGEVAGGMGGAPLMFGALPAAGAMGAGAMGAAKGPEGAVPAKYMPRMKVLGGSPAAGYPAEPVPASLPENAIPPGFAPPPPGFRCALVYLPVSGQEPPV
ncbi:hypothetical protein AWC09_11375 [Mycolicibacter hiberniae]|nr:hypothetical protein AWC09_11375 [Mycolicibacter hiberniae]